MNSKKLALILACAAMAGTSACNEVGHFCEGGNRCDNNVITICEDNEVVQIIDCASQNLTCDTSSWTCVGGADACTGVDCHGGTCNNGTCDCSSLDSKFTYDATCNKTGCTNSNYTLANNCVDPGDPCATVNCNNGTCNNGTCDCSSLDSKFTYDATCTKTGCTDNTLSFVGGDCVATDPCDGVDCHDGTCNNGTCDCSGLDDKFTYDDTCNPTGCTDTTLSLPNCEAVTDPCDGVVCKNETTCDETTGKCDCSGLDAKFTYDDTCEKTGCADSSLSLNNDCAECGEGDTQCVIGYDAESSKNTYSTKACEGGSWADPVACNDGEICNAEKTACVEISEALTCEDDDTFVCQTVGSTQYAVFCSSGEVNEEYTTPCIDKTPRCNESTYSCVDACYGSATCSAEILANIKCGDYYAVGAAYFKPEYDEDNDNHGDNLECTEECTFDFEKYCYACDDFRTCDHTGTYTCADFDGTKTWKEGGAPVCDGCALTVGTCEEDGGDTPTVTTCEDGGVFISEYIHGKNDRRVIELYNAGKSDVDLTQCKMTIKGNDLSLDKTIAAGATYIICSDEKEGLWDGIDEVPTCDLKFKYNDSKYNYTGKKQEIKLVCGDADIDLIGNTSDDWGNNKHFTRKESVVKGASAFDVADWDVVDFTKSGETPIDKNEYADFGQHKVVCSATACREGDKKCVDGKGAYVCGADSTWGTATACPDGCDGDVCKEGDTPTCNVEGGAILDDDGVCICDGLSNYYGDPDSVTGACKKCPEDGYPSWGSTPGCGCDGGKTWNSETNTCESVTVFCTEGKCNGGTCDEETETCDCSGLDDKFTYDDVCGKTGCATSEYTLENGCEAVTLAKCTDIGGDTVNVGALGCRTANNLAICTGTEIWDEDTDQTCVFGCADNDCVSKSAEADENGGICTDETHSAQLTPDGKGYKTDPAQCAADEPWCGTFAEMTGCWECVKDEHCGTGESCVDGACEAAALTCPEGQAVTTSNTCAPITCSLVSIAADVAYAKFSTDFNFESSRIACGEEGTLVSGWKATEATHDAENDDVHNYQYKADLTLLELDNGSYKCAYEVKVGDNWYACDAVSEGWSADNVVKIDDTTADSVIKSMSYERSGGDVEPTTLSLVPAADCAGYEAQDGVDSCAIDGTTVTLSFANGAKVTMALASITANYLGLVDSDNSINITDVNGLSKVKITAKLNGAAQTNSCLVSDSGNTVGELFTWTGTSAVTKEYNVTAGASSISIVGGGASTAYLRITNLVVE